MSQLLEQEDRVGHGRGALGMHRIPVEVAGGECDPERWGIDVRRLLVRTVGTGGCEPGPGQSAGDGVEQPGAVANRTAHAKRGGHEVGGGRRVHGDPAAGRLDSEETARRRRDADRPAAVARMGHRHDPGGDGGGRAAARSAGRVLQVPRIARRSVENRLGGGQQAELRRVGAAQRDQPGPAEAQHDLGGDLAPIVAEEHRSKGERLPFLGRQVLDEEWNAAERAVGTDRLGLAAGGIEARADDRVEGRVDGLEPAHRRFDQLGRRDLAGRDEVGERRRVAVGVFRHRVGHEFPLDRANLPPPAGLLDRRYACLVNRRTVDLRPLAGLVLAAVLLIVLIVAFEPPPVHVWPAHNPDPGVIGPQVP